MIPQFDGDISYKKKSWKFRKTGCDRDKGKK